MANPQHPEPSSRGPMMRQTGLSSAAIGWIVGAVFIVIVMALIFGLGGDGLRPVTSGSPPTTTGTSPSGGPAGTR